MNHIGPMAQDFHASFGLGSTQKGIATVDSAGVALAAIRALVEVNQRYESRMKQLEDRLGQLQKEHGELAVLTASLLADG